MKLDRFDILTATAVSGFLITASFLKNAPEPHTPPPPLSSGSARKAITDLGRARAALDAGKTQKAIGQLTAFAATNPGIAEPHVLLAKAYATQGDYANAIRQYKTAVVMDPEYADLNSDKYIGKGIKSVLSHGWAPCEITLNPERNDAARAAVKDDAAYLQRMLAGGCN